MKKILFYFSFTCLMVISLTAKDTNKRDAGQEINWITFEEAESLMKKKPKKVLIDFYTTWCGWCKVMDKKTYSNPHLIKYINEHFYAIKFDAEQKQHVVFGGKEWKFNSSFRANELAAELMQGKMSYPSTVFMDEGFENAQPIPGYLEVFQMESILKYISGNYHKNTPWNEWQKDFKAEWAPSK